MLLCQSIFFIMNDKLLTIHIIYQLNILFCMAGMRVIKIVTAWQNSWNVTGIILCMRPANERWRYIDNGKSVKIQFHLRKYNLWGCHYLGPALERHQMSVKSNSFHRPLDVCSNTSVVRPTTKTLSKLSVTGPLGRESTNYRWIPQAKCQ